MDAHDTWRNGPADATFKVRIGRNWLAQRLVCEPGGATLVAEEAESGIFTRHDGPWMTAYLARMLLKRTRRVWIKPSVGPGFWIW